LNRGRLISWGGTALLCGVGVLSALLEVLLIPLRAGSILIPVTLLFAIGGNMALPRLARVLLDTTAAMVSAFLAWLLPMLILSLMPRPEGDVLVRGGGGEQWVYYGVLLGGAVAGVATIVLHGAPRRPPIQQPPARRQPAQRQQLQRRPSPKRGR
jgi:hypothetical protein